MFNFSLINLWCTKNLVDSQYVIWKLLSYNEANLKEEINYIAEPYSDEVEYVFLNTCGFLSSGRAEMMEVLQKLLAKWKKVYILWCALQYFKWLKDDSEEYKKEVEEFNKFLQENSGKVFLISWDDVDNISVEKLKKWYISKEFGDFIFPDSPRAYTDISYGYEYLKIAEWCDNHCSFCIIPKIRWKQKSLPMETVMEQTKNMIASWVKEIIIISQDTTRYGTDLYWESKLFELLEQIDKLEWDFVFRLLYLYPDVISLKHLEKLKKLDKFLPYFDIPLQHISSSVLKKMWRFYDTKYIYEFLDFIQNNFENPFIRTNIIAWFPWETNEDFMELVEFLEENYFDNIWLFQYHDEPLAASSKLPNKVDDKTLEYRFKFISNLVDNMLEKKNKKRKKQEQVWYVQDYDNEKLTVRPYMHCPEIDEVDEIKYEDITWVFNDTWEIDLWELVKYKTCFKTKNI